MNSPRRKRSLHFRICSPRALNVAYLEATRGKNRNSYGPDGVTVAAFAKSAPAYLSELVVELRNKTYKPSPGRGVPIRKAKKKGEKSPTKHRPITVFNVKDRVVQRAILTAIWPFVRKRVFSTCSFGGIRQWRIRNSPGKAVQGSSESRSSPRESSDIRKNVRAAACRIVHLRKRGFLYTFETDIRNFFPSIKKSLLISKLEISLQDESINDLLEGAINTSITNIDDMERLGLAALWDLESGVPQGSVLSPLFANFYLADFDHMARKRGYELVRYIDDFVILTRSKQEAENAYEFCKSELEAIGLAIHEIDKPNSKTRIVLPGQPFEFLGLCFNKTTIQPTRKKIDDLSERILDITNAIESKATLVEVINSLNRLLRGWMAAYSFCNVPKGVLREIDHKATTGLAAWLKFHKIVKSLNALRKSSRDRIGLWSVHAQQLSPIL